MNSWTCFTRMLLAAFLAEIPTTRLPWARRRRARTPKSLSPLQMTKVSMWSRVNRSSMASTQMAVSVRFLSFTP